MQKSANHNSQSAILIVGPAWVGDLVMAQSLFKLIKQRQPEIAIDVLAPAWARDLLSCMPEIRQHIISPFAHGELNLRQRYALGLQLRQQHYAQAMVLPNSIKSALVPFFAKIPLRTGWLGEMRWGLLNDVRRLDKEQLPLMIQRFDALALLPQEKTLPTTLPWPSLQLNATALHATLQQFNLKPEQRILVLCPGAEYGPAKRWPAAYFAEVAKNKMAAGWQVVILGSAKDQAIAGTIQQHTPQQCMDLTGKTSLLQAVHLIAAATAVVSNDSGLMHIAAALQKPLIVLYGSSSPQFTPPLTTTAEVLSLHLTCSPCFERECPLGHFKCMQDLKPEQVINKLDKIAQ